MGLAQEGRRDRDPIDRDIRAVALAMVACLLVLMMGF